MIAALVPLLSHGASLLTPKVLSTILALYLIMIGTVATFSVAELVAEPDPKK